MTELYIDTHGVRIGFGKHHGELYTRLPISYLRWMCNSGTREKELAEAELKRRGVGLINSPIEISGHAVDTASLRVWKQYRDTRTDSHEGLHAWLLRMCTEAMTESDANDDDQIFYKGMKLVLVQGDLHWTLKTVMMENKK